jgi:hypothetical protein
MESHSNQEYDISIRTDTQTNGTELKFPKNSYIYEQLVFNKVRDHSGRQVSVINGAGTAGYLQTIK